MEGRDGGEGWREEGKVKVERREGGMGGKEKKGEEEYDKQMDFKYLQTVITLTVM